LVLLDRVREARHRLFERVRKNLEALPVQDDGTGHDWRAFEKN
jgi:hypothetical protein